MAHGPRRKTLLASMQMEGSVVASLPTTLTRRKFDDVEYQIVRRGMLLSRCRSLPRLSGENMYVQRDLDARLVHTSYDCPGDTNALFLSSSMKMIA